MTLSPPAVHPAEAPPQRPRPGGAAPAWPVAADVGCGLLAVAAALWAFLRLRHGLGSELHASTDIVGYPAANDFNPTQYLTTFYLGVVGGPVIALALFALLRWTVGRLVPATVAPRVPWLPAQRGRTRAAPAADTGSSALTAAALVAGPGAVLGVGLAAERGASGARFWLLVALGCVLYAAMVAAGAGGLALIARREASVRQLSGDLRGRVAAVNALCACLTLMVVWAWSHVTVVVSAGGTVHRYGWLPLPLAAALTGGCIGVVVAALWRGRADPRRGVIVERRAVLLVAVPVLILLATSGLYIPGTMTINSFEQGQQYATVHFVQQGMVPWRDFISDHGPFEDTIKLLVGAKAIENSAWGMAAGVGLIVIPLSFITLYWFAHRVARGAAAFTLLAGVLLLHRDAVPVHERILLWPLLLILLWAALESRARWPAPLLGIATVVVALLTPELGFCGIAVGVAVVASDVYRADLSRGTWWRSFATTLGWFAGCAVTLGVAVAILAGLGALQGLIAYLRGAAADHMMTGAIPLMPMVPPYSIWAILPAVGVLLAFLILAVKLRRRAVLSAEDFVMVAAAVLTVLYYQKFTSRADQHVVHPYVASIPLLLIVAHKVFGICDRSLAAVVRRWRQPRRRANAGVAAAVALAVAVVTTPAGLSQIIESIPAHVRVDTPLAQESSPSLGWFAPMPEAPDLQTILSLYLPPGAAIFDFTNEPGIFHYLLGYAPAARRFSIATAYTRSAQGEVIADLQRTRPRIIVFFGDAFGALPEWDAITNPVRSYDVSRWILDNYRPLAAVGHMLLYVERGARVPDPQTVASQLSPAGPLSTSDLYFRERACNWGYAPEFLSIPHPPASMAVDARITSRSAHEVVLDPPAGHRWADYHWMEMEAAGPHFAQDAFVLRDRPDPPEEFRAVTFRTLARATSTYRFPIGACAQWRGYGGAPLRLTHTSGSDVAAVRLLP